MQLLFVVYVKSSDKLLNYLMLVQTLSEVNIEMLKSDDFFPWLHFLTLSCVRREDGRSALTHTVFTILDIHYFDPYQI